MRRIQLDGEHALFVETGFIPPDESPCLMRDLLEACRPIPYTRRTYKVVTNRQTSYHADSPTEMRYWYTDSEVVAEPWKGPLIQLRDRVCQAASEALETEIRFNSALCQYYPNKEAAIDWHSDLEKIYDHSSPIASVSLGGEREFLFRDRSTKIPLNGHPGLSLSGGMLLSNGMLLVMAGPRFQLRFAHSLKKGKANSKERFAVIFRIHNGSLQPELRDKPMVTREDVLKINAEALAYQAAKKLNKLGQI